MELGGGVFENMQKRNGARKVGMELAGSSEGSSQGALKDQHVQAERLLLRAEYSGAQIHYN